MSLLSTIPIRKETAPERADSPNIASTTDSRSGDRGGWVQRIPNSYLDARRCAMSDRSRYIFLILESYARQKPYCYPSNDTLATVSDRSERAVQSALDDLEQGGWIRRVFSNSKKPVRMGIILTRRADPDLPVADTNGRIEEATAKLKAEVAERPGNAPVRRNLHAATAIDAPSTTESSRTSTTESSPEVFRIWKNDESKTAREPGAVPIRGIEGGPEPEDTPAAPSDHRMPAPLPPPTPPPRTPAPDPAGCPRVPTEDEWDVIPGTHSPARAEVEATWRLAWQLFGSHRVCLDYFERQRAHSTRAWQSALREARKLKPKMDRINYAAAIAANNPDGVQHRPSSTPRGRAAPLPAPELPRVELTESQRLRYAPIRRPRPMAPPGDGPGRDPSSLALDLGRRLTRYSWTASGEKRS